MVLGGHYLDESAAQAIVTIPIASGSLSAWLEYVLTMIDGRINQRCNLSSNTSNTMDKAALSSVEFNALLKVIKNTRLSREGVPAEVDFLDSFFSAEDKWVMQDIRDKNKYVAKGYAREAVV
jgi:hypothetical protein